MYVSAAAASEFFATVVLTAPVCVLFTRIYNTGTAAERDGRAAAGSSSSLPNSYVISEVS